MDAKFKPSGSLFLIEVAGAGFVVWTPTHVK